MEKCTNEHVPTKPSYCSAVVILGNRCSHSYDSHALLADSRSIRPTSNQTWQTKELMATVIIEILLNWATIHANVSHRDPVNTCLWRQPGRTTVMRQTNNIKTFFCNWLSLRFKISYWEAAGITELLAAFQQTHLSLCCAQAVSSMSEFWCSSCTMPEGMSWSICDVWCLVSGMLFHLWTSLWS